MDFFHTLCFTLVCRLRHGAAADTTIKRGDAMNVHRNLDAALEGGFDLITPTAATIPGATEVASIGGPTAEAVQIAPETSGEPALDDNEATNTSTRHQAMASDGEDTEGDDDDILLDFDDLERAAQEPDDPIFGAFEPGLLGLILGVPSISKSTIALNILVAVAAGVEFAGITPPRPQPCVFFSPEDAPRIIGRRMIAACDELGADRALVKRNLKVVHFKQPVMLLEKSDDGQTPTLAGERLIRRIMKHRARLVAFDPLVELHGAQENDNGEMHGVFRTFRALAEKAGCAILLTHHTPKEALGKASLFSGRGAGSMAGAVRIILTADILSKQEAESHLSEGVLLTDLLKLDTAKVNYRRRGQSEVIFRRVDADYGRYRAPALRRLA
jgi:RecA-family ATPase